MTSTPPPPRRLRTPPTPRHGPKYDSHEPYSPRRSSRISAKRDEIASLDDMTSPFASHHHSTTSTSTPRASRKHNYPRTASQTFSPPSSPISPDTRHGKVQDRLVKSVNSRVPQVRTGRSSTEPDSDLDASKSLNAHRAKRPSADMLPTPRKTPRKKPSHSTTQLGSTARALFLARPPTVEDAMPSPRKSRLNRKRGAFTLDGFADEGNDDGIEIYTDSKERVPDVDETEENPFLSRKTSRKPRTGQSSESTRKKTKKMHDGMTAEIDEAVKNNEGMVYVFRGKKFYRKFEEVNGYNEADDADELGNSDILHQAGPASRRPFTRSAITPRLLFPPKEPTPERLLDEEALTDIEASDRPAATDDDNIVTPIKMQFKPVTPPTTGHATRRKGQKFTPDSSPIVPKQADFSQSPSGRSARSMFLDAWPRSKPGVTSGSTKREGDHIERSDGASGKRAKGTSH